MTRGEDAGIEVVSRLMLWSLQVRSEQMANYEKGGSESGIRKGEEGGWEAPAEATVLGTFIVPKDRMRGASLMKYELMSLQPTT